MHGRLSWVGAWMLLGCGPTVGVGEGETSGGSGEGLPPITTAANTSAVTITGASGASSSATTIDDGGSDDMAEDGGIGFAFDCGQAPPGTEHHCTGVPTACDLTLPSCPANARCAPWGEDGLPGWSSSRCVPMVDEPAGVGEPCEIAGDPWSGMDTCDAGLFCVAGELSLHEGLCWALCSAQGGEPPGCAGEAACVWRWNDVVPVCVESCDPLLQDCAMGRCDAGREPFGCLPSVGAGAELGEPCVQPGDCADAGACVDASQVPGCAGASCCAAFCDVVALDPESACSDGLRCAAWPGALAGYEHVGTCSSG